MILTPKGQEFLDKIRDPKAWEQIKARAQTLESVNLEDLQQIAKMVAKGSDGEMDSGCDKAHGTEGHQG